MARRKGLVKNGPVYTKCPIPGTSSHLLSALGSSLPFGDRDVLGLPWRLFKGDRWWQGGVMVYVGMMARLGCSL